MAGDIPFLKDMRFDYGAPDALSPMVRRVIARNPSAFTFHGTGTYIVGRGKVAVIDPGPAYPEHLEALMRATDGEEVTHILVTHTHIDHSPLAAALKARTGAPTHGFGFHGGGREDVQVEEGGDYDFAPDYRLADGDAVEGDGWTFNAVHTPGHTSNHLCFGLAQEKALFCGDHVMGWSTTVVSPPDGDMAAYMASLHKLLSRDDAVFYPTHGPPVRDPRPFVEAYIAHREMRDGQILAHLAEGPKTIPEMVATMYADVPRNLHHAAGRSVLAHLIHMEGTGRVGCDGTPDDTLAVFSLAR
ncbi:MAG: MBL fold metallo-hydrolase [Rhodospirillales bacterium]|jgi:glyoxylase-like metal-dependent hydrolase (beta-lactamase superfamily II)|nr:MBL fold metallo-hydrolase [Rhodospirillales bacterium]